MSQNKKKNAGHPTKGVSGKGTDHKGASAKNGNPRNRTALVIGGLVLALIVGAILLSQGGSGKGGALAQPTAEEQRYLGRLLPAGYEAPSVSGAQVYASNVEMTDVAPAETDSTLSISLDKVVSAKIAAFTYEGAQSLPLMAYVKPSGKLFVGVSYCPPCQGERQRIESDRTLTCASCGTKRDLESMAGISGTCKLYPLDEVPVTVSNGQIVIERAVLDSWTPQPLDRAVG